MSEKKLLKLIYSSSVAAMVTIVVITATTIWGELSAPFKDFLKSLSGHHWLTKGFLVIAVYILSCFVFYSMDKNSGDVNLRKSLIGLVWITIGSTLVIYLFFVGHYYGWF